ncbi:hypothetical protein EMCRGX_G001178 [Ephydatia muelleri]
MAECGAITEAAKAFLILQSLIAGIILLVLSFMKKRVHLCPTTMRGVPGLIMPVNLMRITPHRVINAVAFASMSSTILTNVLFPPSFGTVGNAYGQVFIAELTKWFWVLFQTVLYFPLFGCLNAPIRWLGMVWLGLGMDTPIYACLAILIIYYAVQSVQEINKHLSTRNSYLHLGWNQHNNEETDYYKQWVKELLRYKRPDNGNVSVYKYEPKVFKFSSRFMSTMVVMFVLVYQLALLSISLLLQLILFFSSLVLNILTQQASSENTISIVNNVVKGLQAAAVIGPCITSIIVYCILVHMVKCVRNDLKRAVRGDLLSFHMPNSAHETSTFSVPIPSPNAIVASSLNYMAYQVAHLVVGWIIICFAVFGVGATIGIIVLLFIFARTFILPKIVSLIVALILMLIVYIVQRCMCKYVFIDKTFETCGKHQTAKDTVITHVQLYHWWTYVFFIINTFSGLLSSFLRSLCSAVIVMLLLIRMDRNIYIKGLERFDRGYSTYVTFLYLEYVQNHPIMSAFVQILGEGKSNDTSTRTSQKGIRVYFAATFDDQILKERCTIDIKKGNCCISRRARIRWFVAYTLLRNPDLQCLTSNRLNEAKLSNAASANEKTDNDVSS